MTMSRGMRVISIALMPMPAPATIQVQASAMTTVKAPTTTARSRRNKASNIEVDSSVTASRRPHFQSALWDEGWAGSIRPMNGSVVSILAGIVPTHAVVGERAVLAANGKRKPVWRDGMTDRGPNLAGRVQAAQRFYRDVRDPGDADRTVLPLHGVVDRYLFGSEVLRNQWREYRHRAARRSAKN